MKQIRTKATVEREEALKSLRSQLLKVTRAFKLVCQLMLNRFHTSDSHCVFLCIHSLQIHEAELSTVKQAVQDFSSPPVSNQNVDHSKLTQSMVFP